MTKPDTEHKGIPGDPNTKTEKVLSHDELLAQQHEEYMRKVIESGVPLWVLGLYSSGGMYEH